MSNGKEIAAESQEEDGGRRVAPRRDMVSETESSLEILLQKVTGGSSFAPTEKQVDEILSQRRQVIDYIHEDKKIASSNSKIYLISVLAFILILSALVLWLDPNLFSQVLSFLAGVIGGGLGGYGFGKSKD